MLSMGFLGRLVTSYAPRDRSPPARHALHLDHLGGRRDHRCSGKVTGKREENGEKLIDLEVKCTNQNGQDTLQGHATVAAA